jgi:hypothetical protein
VNAMSKAVETTVPVVDFNQLTDEQLIALIQSRGITASTLAVKEKEEAEKEYTSCKAVFKDSATATADVLRVDYGVVKIHMVYSESDSTWTIGYVKKEDVKVFGKEEKESKVPVLLRNGDKTYSGRGIFPSWGIDFLLSTENFEKYTAKKLYGIVSPAFEDKGENKVDHETAWVLLRAKFPV